MLTVVLDEHLGTPALIDGLVDRDLVVLRAVDLTGEGATDDDLLAATWFLDAILVTGDVRLGRRHIFQGGRHHGGVLVVDRSSLRLSVLDPRLADLVADALEHFEHRQQFATLYVTRAGEIELDWGPLTLGELHQLTGGPRH